MIEAGFYAFLNAEVTDVDGRVYPMHAPETAAYPYIVYDIPDTALLDDSGGPVELTFATFSVRVFSESHLEMTNVVDAARQSLNGYIGALGARAARSIRVTSRRTAYEPSKIGKGKGVYEGELLGVIEYDEDL
jgi:hypothetical protein